MSLSTAVRYAGNRAGSIFTPDANTVLWLPGQDDAYSSTIRDRSGNGNNGAISGATWVQNSKGLWGLEFDGNDDRISFTAISSAARTQMGWFYLDQGAVAKGNWNYIWNNIYQHTGNNYFYIDSGGSNSWVVAIPVGSWMHLAFVVPDKTNIVGSILYINGTPTTITAAAGYALPNLTSISHTTSGWAWDGKVFLPTVLNIAATAAQVQANRNQTRSWFGV